MDVAYEPFSTEAQSDPYPLYRALRDHRPVYWAEGARSFVVSRYDDVAQALRDPEWFSSDAMGRMLAGAEAVPQPAPDPATRPRIIILSDPPVHGPLRNVLNRGFTPRRIAALEPRIRELVDEALVGLRRGDPFDLVGDLAVPVPVSVIAELLGVERERGADFKAWSDAIIATVTGSQRGSRTGGAFQAAMTAMGGYLASVAAERRSAPRDDLISALVHAGDEGESLAIEEVVMFAVVLLIAGNETTTNLIGSMASLLLEHPEQLERVRQRPELVPGLVEETLRCESPVQFLYRRATRDVELAGTRIPSDAGVLLLLGSANRDERRFPEPDRFDPGRDARGHLAFGFGVHFCLGASLARLEARVAAEALLDELPTLERRTRVLENVDSFMMRGPRRLELERAA